MADKPGELRYVVLRHEGIADPHFDLMFETAPGSELATWRSDTWPATEKSILTPLPDHRRAYLEYEGPVSNNRGHVKRVAAGCHSIEHNDALELRVVLEDGSRLCLRRS